MFLFCRVYFQALFGTLFVESVFYLTELLEKDSHKMIDIRDKKQERMWRETQRSDAMFSSNCNTSIWGHWRISILFQAEYLFVQSIHSSVRLFSCTFFHIHVMYI